jgi:leucyl aminopeptidase
MPLDENYNKLLKSNIADMKNVGGRAANAITAAQFLQRFIEDDLPWIHLDIAGVASTGSETKFAPKGASGWGVKTLNRLVADFYEIK